MSDAITAQFLAQHPGYQAQNQPPVGIQPSSGPNALQAPSGDAVNSQFIAQHPGYLPQHPQIANMLSQARQPADLARLIQILAGGTGGIAADGNLGGSGVGSADSGHDFGGARGPGQGARGTAEQGVGWADFGFGLLGGAIAGPAFGLATALSRTALDPSYNPIDPYGFLGSLFGGSSSAADSMGNNPGISGSTGFTGAESTAATGGGTGGASGLGGSGPSSGIGAGPGGSNAGAYAGGGIVGGMAPFSPWQDNRMAQVRSGEAILPSGMVNQLGPQNVMNMIRRFQQTGMNPVGRSIMPPGVQQILGR